MEHIPWKWRSEELRKITQLMKGLSDVELEFMPTLVEMVIEDREFEQSLPTES